MKIGFPESDWTIYFVLFLYEYESGWQAFAFFLNILNYETNSLFFTPTNSIKMTYVVILIFKKEKDIFYLKNTLSSENINGE